MISSRLKAHTKRMTFPWNRGSLGCGLALGWLVVLTVYLNAASAQDAEVQDQAVAYNVEFRGVENSGLVERLRQYSKSVELRGRKPPSMALLRRRLENDIPRLVNVLKSEGFFDARVEFSLDESSQPITAVFQVEAGPVYVLGEVSVEWVESASPEIETPKPVEMGLAPGEPFNADAASRGGNVIERRLHDRGYPLARVDDQTIYADHAARRAELIYRVDAGPRAVFGETRIEGLTTVHEKYVRNRLRWREGELYDARKIDETQTVLIKTGLFALAQIQPATQTAPDGALPVTLTLNERKPRTVSAGAFYQTDDGPGGKLGWEHRNLFGGGEDLSTEVLASFIEYSGHVTYRQPDFLDVDQFLVLDARVADDHPDAYESKNISLSAMLERVLNDEMKLRGGVKYRLADITQRHETDTFGLLSFPVEFEWDASDDLLDPTRGGRLNVSTEPFYGTLGSNLLFFKNYLKYGHYFELASRPELIAAARIGLGSIVGAPSDSLPADERFYAGGGGSIRGYPYQTVSPLIGNDPIGGRSIIELSFELRWRLSQSIGLVFFVDGGDAFESSVPDFSDNLLWGTGVGFRYFTPIGPVRLDVGVPLNRRPGIDDPFQIYVSIGQSF
ncbi:MAG: BamA/TamA family outer membrane protein [bacterium]|nr:BamA/TamA family outer membrane protein [bacterium]